MLIQITNIARVTFNTNVYLQHNEIATVQNKLL